MTSLLYVMSHVELIVISDFKWHKEQALASDVRWNVIMFDVKDLTDILCPGGSHWRKSTLFPRPQSHRAPAAPLGPGIDPLSPHNGTAKHTMQAACLRSLVLLQPLLMQLMYYLAESVITTCTVQLLAGHNTGCCPFPWLLQWRQITGEGGHSDTRAAL